MKTAIYIEDGVVQLVITPETEHEKAVVQLFEDKQMTAKVMVGTFYGCQGGWYRQSMSYGDYASGHNRSEDRSLILRMDTERAAPAVLGE